MTVLNASLRSGATIAVFALFSMFVGYYHIYLVWQFLLSDLLYRHFDSWVLSY